MPTGWLHSWTWVDRPKLWHWASSAASSEVSAAVGKVSGFALHWLSRSSRLFVWLQISSCTLKRAVRFCVKNWLVLQWNNHTSLPRKRIIATGGTPRTSVSDKEATPQHLASLRRTSAFDTTPILKTSMSPFCQEIKDSSTKGFQFRKSISSVLPMGNDTHDFEDSSCLISDVQTPGSSWRPSLSSTRPTLNVEKEDKSSISFNFWSSNDQNEDCTLRPSSRLSDVQIVDTEPEALFYSPKKAVSGPEVTADCRGGSGRQSSSHTTSWTDADGDDFYIDDFDIDEFEDADIPEYFDEPPSTSTSKRTSMSLVSAIREGGPVKTTPARSAVSTPSPASAPKAAKPPSPGKLENRMQI